MKYGMRERLSGAVIVIALAVIFVPMLFDEPAPREERPQPVLTIEQPIEVERTPVPDPEPPSTLGNISQPRPVVDPQGSVEALSEEATSSEDDAEVARAPATDEQASEENTPPAEVQPETADPIAELARAAEQRRETSAPSPSNAAGEWAVQAGSFGKPDNAERLEAQLNEQGFNAYRRQREGGLTSVYVGPYESSEAGERARTELKERANIQGLLVRIREGE
ncbi:SPOR domain-containing protein [Litchfieldella anticariensis]|nr:SPOR domain-containing protein [Halomonas anticariensis]